MFLDNEVTPSRQDGVLPRSLQALLHASTAQQQMDEEDEEEEEEPHSFQEHQEGDLWVSKEAVSLLGMASPELGTSLDCASGVCPAPP